MTSRISVEGASFLSDGGGGGAPLGGIGFDGGGEVQE